LVLAGGSIEENEVDIPAVKTKTDFFRFIYSVLHMVKYIH